MARMAVLRCLNTSLYFILFCQVNSESTPASLMRATKCIIPNGKDHITRAALFQQCLSNNYAQGNETQCFDELGCFTMEYPWVSLTRPFPSPIHPAEINTRLYCYTRDSPQRYNITLWPEISLEGCPFQANRTTMFLAHGFSSDGNTTWMADLKDNYLDAVDANVFLVDWGAGASSLNYLQVASNTRIVGSEVARFIRHLQKDYGLVPSHLHLIGHSLGAHISSYTAKNITGVHRLTALDPAQPGFEGLTAEVRLDEGDAEYVEAVHTNAAPFIPTLGFGLMMPVGHVDFYMNGGLRQPGCAIPDVTEIKSIGDLAKFPVEIVNSWVSCSHGRAYQYFIQALRDNCTIWGRLSSLGRHFVNTGTLGVFDSVTSTVETCEVDSCTALGLETPEYEARGIFSATTPRRSPFCNDQDENEKILNDIYTSASKKAKGLAIAVGGNARDAALGVAGKTADKTSDIKNKLGGLLG